MSHTKIIISFNGKTVNRFFDNCMVYLLLFLLPVLEENCAICTVTLQYGMSIPIFHKRIIYERRTEENKKFLHSCTHRSW